MRGERFSFDVQLTGPTAELFGAGVISRWSYAIEPAGDGCLVTETTEDLRTADVIATSKVFLADIPDRAAHNRGTMTTTLDRLAAGVGQGESRCQARSELRPHSVGPELPT